MGQTMNGKRLKKSSLKIAFLLLFFCLVSFVIEVSFFNKDFFYFHGNRSYALVKKVSFDYYWIRHLTIFLILIVSFIFQKKQINIKNLKPYSALFVFLINIIPGVFFISKYLFLFISFLLYLYIKSDFSKWKYKCVLRKNMFVFVFFLMLFIVFFPMLLKEGYVYDPLAQFTNWPGYRLSHVSGLRETAVGTSDLLDAFLPQKKYIYQSIKEGFFPLWRFNKGIGEPVYRQSYHPDKLISFIVDPYEALTLQVLIKLFLSMTGMFLLLRTIKIREVLCIIGGIAYAFSGFTIGWLHGPQSSASYHIPFLFLFLIHYLKTKKIKFLFCFAIWSSLIVYSGFIAVAGYAFYGIGLFLILSYLFARRRLSQKIKELPKISLFWILGIITVAFQFVPLYYSIFVRKSLDLSYRNIGKISFLSPKYFKNILFPSFHGWNITPEIRPYISAVIILFFLVGLIYLILKFIKLESIIFDREKYYISFFLLLIPFGMAMFGLFPFYQISCKLPVLNSSSLSRLQSITCFLLVILGIMGLELFVQSYNKIFNFFKKRRYLFISITGILYLSSALMGAASLLSDKEKGFHSMHLVFILLAFVLLVFQISIVFKRTSAFFLIILLLCVSVELTILNRRYVPVNKKAHFISELNVPLVNYVKRNSEKYEGVLVFDSNYNINGTLGIYGIREMIVHQFFTYDYKALIIDTFSRMSFASPTAPALVSRNTDFASSFIQLLGVKYLIFRSEFKGKKLPPYYSLVYHKRDGKVYLNRLYKKNRGIFFCKAKYYKPEDRQEVIKLVKSMDYSKYAFIEDDERANLDYKENMSCSINRIQYSPNRVVYRYRANSDGILTFPEAFNEGWSVTVNGKDHKVLKTNLIFREIGRAHV